MAKRSSHSSQMGSRFQRLEIRARVVVVRRKGWKKEVGRKARKKLRQRTLRKSLHLQRHCRKRHKLLLRYLVMRALGLDQSLRLRLPLLQVLAMINLRLGSKRPRLNRQRHNLQHNRQLQLPIPSKQCCICHRLRRQKRKMLLNHRIYKHRPMYTISILIHLCSRLKLGDSRMSRRLLV